MSLLCYIWFYDLVSYLGTFRDSYKGLKVGRIEPLSWFPFGTLA